MNIKKQCLLAVASAALLAGCSPSTSTAEDVLRKQIASESQGNVTLVGFKKTDGQKFEVNGISGYNLAYEATVEFRQNAVWIPGDRLNANHPGLTWSLRKAGAGVDFLDSMGGATSVNAGKRVTFAGKMTGEKTENGWQFHPGDSHIFNGQ